MTASFARGTSHIEGSVSGFGCRVNSMKGMSGFIQKGSQIGVQGVV